jgi:diguanylate cyclase (GGDEF)-like protein
VWGFFALFLCVFFYCLIYIKHLLKKNKTAALEIKTLREQDEQSQKRLHSLENQLRLMVYDPVTGLTGFRLFKDRLEQSIHESRRYQFTMAVLFVDIDQFKIINEALGQHISDYVLQEVAKRLQACIRKVDSIARLAKDTFVVLLTQINKPETAAIVAQRMLQSLESPISVNANTIQVSAGIGITIFPADGNEAADLFRNAEQALQLAKEKGSQVYQFYQGKIHFDSMRELSLLTRLKGEVIPHEFEIYYQPIIDVRTNTIFCLDTSLHWNHPEFGLVPPQELAHYTEKLGKSNRFTEWVFHNAYQHFRAWRDAVSPSAMLGLPLTLTQLKNDNFIYRISQWLQETAFKPEWLLLAIQSSHRDAPVVLEDVEKGLNMLQYLHLNLAVENVGADLFALLNLKKAPIRYAKISQSLFYNGQHEQTAALIKAAVALAKSLSMQFIIQDIRSVEQVEIFHQSGCHFFQGPLIGQPLPLKEIRAASLIV